MAVYAFETITADEAMSLMADDTVMVASSSALLTQATLQSTGAISVTIGGRTVLFGSALVDVALGGNLRYPDLSRLLIGSDDDDDVSVQADLPVAILGGGGDDSLTAHAEHAMVQGAAGDDVLSGLTGVALFGGQGADVLSVIDTPLLGGVSFLHGNTGDDMLLGGVTADVLLGGQGNDLLLGVGGYDTLIGNLGDDIIVGGGELHGEDGADQLTASDDGALADGGDGDDTIEGGSAADLLLGGDGHDVIVDRGGFANQIDGGYGDDLVHVLAGSAAIYAGYGADTLDASSAESVSFSGEGGDDAALGSTGADALDGGDGADTLDGGGGGDVFFGGEGGDLFVFTAATDTTDLALLPQILDWSAGDRIQFAEPVRNLVMTITSPDLESAFTSARALGGSEAVDVVAIQVGFDVFVFWQDAQTVVMLAGCTLSDVSTSAFI